MKPVLLIIEDDKYLIRAYQAKFGIEGYRLLIAHDVDEALRLLSDHDIDVIILDLIMPLRSGTQFLKELHQNSQKKHIPVIVATNLANPKEREACMLYGVTNYCLKSEVSIDSIEAMVKEALQK